MQNVRHAKLADERSIGDEVPRIVDIGVLGEIPDVDAALFCLTILLWPSRGYDLNEASPSRRLHKTPTVIGSQAPDPRHFGFANATLARPPESGDCSEISEAEIAQRWVIVGTAAELPVIFALALLDRQIVDAGDPQTHQSVVVELPVFVAV